MVQYQIYRIYGSLVSRLNMPRVWWTNIPKFSKLSLNFITIFLSLTFSSNSIFSKCSLFSLFFSIHFWPCFYTRFITTSTQWPIPIFLHIKEEWNISRSPSFFPFYLLLYIKNFSFINPKLLPKSIDALKMYTNTIFMLYIVMEHDTH